MHRQQACYVLDRHLAVGISLDTESHSACGSFANYKAIGPKRHFFFLRPRR
jgi:hypothetical protein